MRILIMLLLTGVSGYAFAGFVHPMDFDGSESQKNEVVQYIKGQVRKDYCDGGLDMCQNTILRMMEQENLEAFKKGTRAKNRTVMDRAIKDYCNSGLDMCNYTTIMMMYDENVAAGQKELDWK